MEKLPSNTSLFLDSGNGWLGDQDQKDRFISFDSPLATLSFSDGVTTVVKDGKSTSSKRDPLNILEGYLAQGYVATGYIGYEYSKYTESGFLPKHHKDGDRYPDVLFNIHDSQDRQVGDIAQLKSALRGLEQKEINPSVVSESKLSSNIGVEAYKDLVKRVKGYIKSGDIYQVNLSQRYTAQLDLSPLDYFLRFYNAQPVPFGCLGRNPDSVYLEYSYPI